MADPTLPRPWSTLGLGPSTRAHFTTKDKGKGTGLGLTSAFEFAESLGGKVLIDSTPAQGTAVTLALPRVDPFRPSRTKAVEETNTPKGERISAVTLLQDKRVGLTYFPV
ncbi:MAG: ATP-binding protein [Beijerinckiaceae bacterium]